MPHPWLLMCELCPPLKMKWAVCLMHTCLSSLPNSGMPICLEHYEQADKTSGHFIFYKLESAVLREGELERYVAPPPPAKKKTRSSRRQPKRP